VEDLEATACSGRKQRNKICDGGWGMRLTLTLYTIYV